MKSLKLISSAIAMLICLVTFGQEKTITGKVSDTSGSPLPGVNVLIKGTQNGTQTGFDGLYSIKAKVGNILMFSSIGFKNKEITVGNINTINVTMGEDSSSLQEVVVLGYGTQKRKAVTGSIQNFKSTEIKRNKNGNINQNLQGKVAGVSISANNGPSNQNIKIRGAASLNQNQQPLYIVDGVPIDQSTITKINPNDIKDINVLKDPSATSIYGYMASSGVIIINTKNGVTKKLSKKELKRRIEIIKKENLKNRPLSPIDEPNQEDYETFVENAFESPSSAPLSTFSIDVDNASYTNVRRFINNGQTVPKDAVRVEEMVNFFKYQYPQPKDEHPFSINTEYSDCPWNEKNKLVRIGLQGKNIPTNNLPNSNFVFLIDVSGSMSDQNRLPLVIESMKILVKELREEDKISIVVYAGAAGLVLPSTSGKNKEIIIEALEKLNAGGSTAGGEGINLAYKVAQENFIKGGNNRVILATDGDFNVGASSDNDMERLIVEKRKSGVFLTCLGYGMGNYKDSKMETLADKGNGNYAYIDNIQEANRFLSKEFKGSMFAIAKDVKIQIEFNPKHVQSYRLIGYENRKLRPEDFKNDAIDAGELGSGHIVTAIYEIIPTGVKSDFTADLNDLKYTKPKETGTKYNDELATIKFRYKKPDGEKSIEMINIIDNQSKSINNVSADFKFCAAVAWFGLKLRESKLISNKSQESILNLAKEGLSNDTEGYKAELIRLIESVKQI